MPQVQVAFADAVVHGNLEQVRALLAGGQDADMALDVPGEHSPVTGAFLAARRVDVRMLELLFSLGAAPSQKDRYGNGLAMTVVMALADDNVTLAAVTDALDLLRRHGVDLADEHVTYKSVLEPVALCCGGEGVSALVTLGAHPDRMTLEQRRSAVAATAGALAADALGVLVDLGCDALYADQIGRSAFTLAVRRALICEETGDIDPRRGFAASEAPEALAVVGRLLCRAGGDINGATLGGITPLHVAADSGSAACVRVLIELGADVRAADTDGETPLHMAAQAGSPEAVEALLATGAPPEARSQKGATALHFAALSRAEDSALDAVVGLLAGAGAQIDCMNDARRTPLMLAVGRASGCAVDVLLRHGANPNLITDFGGSLLHLLGAFLSPGESGSYTDVIRILLRHGVDINHRDLDGRTALFRAASWTGSPEIVEALLTAGADDSIPDRHGRDFAQFVLDAELADSLHTGSPERDEKILGQMRALAASCAARRAMRGIAAGAAAAVRPTA